MIRPLITNSSKLFALPRKFDKTALNLFHWTRYLHPLADFEARIIPEAEAPIACQRVLVRSVVVEQRALVDTDTPKQVVDVAVRTNGG